MDYLFPLVISFSVVITIVTALVREHRRQHALRHLAPALGLEFRGDMDRALVDRFPGFDLLRQGRNRCARFVFGGHFRGHRVTAFEFHFQTRSVGANGRTRFQHHFHTCLVCDLPTTLPGLKVLTGYRLEEKTDPDWQQIEVDAPAFSARYRVVARDEKFAREFLHGEMIQFFVDNPGMILEIHGDKLLLATGGKLDPQYLEHHLRRFVAISELAPCDLGQMARSASHRPDGDRKLTLNPHFVALYL